MVVAGALVAMVQTMVVVVVVMAVQDDSELYRGKNLLEMLFLYCKTSLWLQGIIKFR